VEVDHGPRALLSHLTAGDMAIVVTWQESSLG